VIASRKADRTQDDALLLHHHQQPSVGYGAGTQDQRDFVRLTLRLLKEQFADGFHNRPIIFRIGHVTEWNNQNFVVPLNSTAGAQPCGVQCAHIPFFMQPPKVR